MRNHLGKGATHRVSWLRGYVVALAVAIALSAAAAVPAFAQEEALVYDPSGFVAEQVPLALDNVSGPLDVVDEVTEKAAADVRAAEEAAEVEVAADEAAVVEAPVDGAAADVVAAAQVGEASASDAAAPVPAEAQDSVVAEPVAGQAAAAPPEEPWVWEVAYHWESNATQGPADGSVAQWRSGYFIAHNWSDAGQIILSRPGYVRVDGVTYAYAGEQWISRDTPYECGPQQFANANGGIGFQTCCDGGYLLVHYEPC